jgi:hypothetical protein
MVPIEPKDGTGGEAGVVLPRLPASTSRML